MLVMEVIQCIYILVHVKDVISSSHMGFLTVVINGNFINASKGNRIWSQNA